MITPEPPDLLPQDLTDSQRRALQCICRAGGAYRVRGTWRAKDLSAPISRNMAAFFLDLKLARRSTSTHGTAVLAATEKGYALVGMPIPGSTVARPAPRPRFFHEPAETPILDADVFDDPFSGA